VKRSLMPVLATGLSLGAVVVSAQGVTIDHKPVGCIVAGQYPKMNACFLPAPNIARGRVYFRAGGTTHWYFVDGKREMPCHGFVLPKPKKIKSVDYYVEGMDTGGGEGRTTEYFPVVVLRASECKKDVPVAPFLTRASVVVGAAPGAPAIIPGFTGFVGATAGGLSTGAILGIVAAGGAVAGTAAIVSSNDNPPSVATLPPVTTLIAVTTTTTTTTTVPTAQPFNAVFKIFPNPPQGTEPFEVTFDECESTGVNLRFIYDFDGDGLEDLRGGCSDTRVYRLAGVSTSGALPVTTVPPASRVFPATVCVASGSTHRQCVLWRIVVTENTGLSVGPPEATSAPRRVAWASELDLAGGSGQVVVNGESAAFAGRGRSAGAAHGRRGVNRIEAQVVEAAGTPGTWRFELDTTGSLQPGTIRVIAGEVALVTESAVVFRLKGRRGERIVFSFRTDR